MMARRASSDLTGVEDLSATRAELRRRESLRVERDSSRARSRVARTGWRSRSGNGVRGWRSEGENGAYSGEP